MGVSATAICFCEYNMSTIFQTCDSLPEFPEIIHSQSGVNQIELQVDALWGTLTACFIVDFDQFCPHLLQLPLDCHANNLTSGQTTELRRQSQTKSQDCNILLFMKHTTRWPTPYVKGASLFKFYDRLHVYARQYLKTVLFHKFYPRREKNNHRNF